ncbi:S8/S53 family peptidase [Endozoicomonas euniceicola]|uniref:S8/S53 family peptidase n=1 Tax=Endozoicomonas euniceicola TaxID=1234143 RepID=A0ABY6GY64_9GAMM|nr:S8/S53 family peptidase [Endozoicomonas euniceicola]UYM16948.1 S8/S53 family peptidase [Endozoicomonas euniceicola]
MRLTTFLLLLITNILITLLVQPLHASDQKIFKVAILDRFYPRLDGFGSDEDRSHHSWLYGMVDIDNDEVKEPFYHGDIVRMIAAHPRITFITYPIQDGRAPMSEIRRNLQKIYARLQVQPLDALVLSWESSTLTSSFNEPLRRANVEEYKKVIYAMGRKDPVWADTYEIIRWLEKIVDQGVAVYTISGNGGRGMVNTFSFAEGVVTVGASEYGLRHYIADNPFVDVHAQAAYELRRVDDAEGNTLGYDINGDHCVDISRKHLSSAASGQREAKKQWPEKYWRLLVGSSFAAPAALRSALFSDLEINDCAQR